MTDKNPIVINFEHVKLYENEAVVFMPVNGKMMAFTIPSPGVRARFDREFFQVSTGRKKEDQ